MAVSNAIQTMKTLRQAYRNEAEKHPVKEISQDAADKFNQLLNDLKKKYPANRFIIQMQPLTPHKTQLAGLWAKLDVLEGCIEIR